VLVESDAMPVRVRCLVRLVESCPDAMPVEDAVSRRDGNDRWRTEPPSLHESILATDERTLEGRTWSPAWFLLVDVAFRAATVRRSSWHGDARRNGQLDGTVVSCGVYVVRTLSNLSISVVLVSDSRIESQGVRPVVLRGIARCSDATRSTCGLAMCESNAVQPPPSDVSSTSVIPCSLSTAYVLFLIDQSKMGSIQPSTEVKGTCFRFRMHPCLHRRSFFHSFVPS
jgi:hypothetical protein